MKKEEIIKQLKDLLTERQERIYKSNYDTCEGCRNRKCEEHKIKITYGLPKQYNR